MLKKLSICLFAITLALGGVVTATAEPPSSDCNLKGGAYGCEFQVRDGADITVQFTSTNCQTQITKDYAKRELIPLWDNYVFKGWEIKGERCAQAVWPGGSDWMVCLPAAFDAGKSPEWLNKSCQLQVKVTADLMLSRPMTATDTCSHVSEKSLPSLGIYCVDGAGNQVPCAGQIHDALAVVTLYCECSSDDMSFQCPSPGDEA